MQENTAIKLTKFGVPKKSGGRRVGAGAKKLEPTDTISFRVPLKLKQVIKDACIQTIRKYI